MGTLHKDSVFKIILKNLCCTYGWSYGAFWSYGQPNSMLLTLQDAYFDDKFGSLIDNLLLQVPIGGGVIGQAAYTNKHIWMSSEDQYRIENSSGSISDMYMTIAVIPVEPQGVVQFGSNEKILENIEFVNQTKRMFQESVNGVGSEIGMPLLNGQIFNQDEAFSSLISSDGSCFTGGYVDLARPNCSSTPFDELSNFGISNELFPNGDIDVSQWFSPLNPVNYNEKCEPLTISGTDVDFLGNNGDLGDILAPIINGSQSQSQSQSQLGLHSYSHVDGTALGPKERLFSKLGIEELLEGISGISNAASSSCIDGQVLTKRRKTRISVWEESMPKMQPGLQMADVYSMSGSSTVLQAKKQVEPPKPTKKRAKPGTRPRPKDRQQILDRMAELRQLIPNGEKMSIDCLLDRTIKHMIFLEGVTKQADKIKQAEERNHKDAVPNDPSTNGVTWACELGNQNLVCPLIVEDLGAPGQMLIEMLCEENGLFLEIMDIIRRFGLIILKGVMETRSNKIWARFIVESEVNKQITRHEIFSELVQFLQTMTPKVDKACMKSGNFLLDEYNLYGIQNLVNMGDVQYCVNL
ncbi:transcription factor bHLH157-like isoform X2 [Rutidosis leptorrhynchoides]|uniref:transcription factor bHLH157-like isoform X2 n=1 Tax=Rutidosis leptorrhynchoides TaxID=125765 RepID=UPI003A9A03BD